MHLPTSCLFSSLSSSWKSLIIPFRRNCQHKQCRLQNKKIQNKSTCRNLPGKYVSKRKFFLCSFLYPKSDFYLWFWSILDLHNVKAGHVWQSRAPWHDFCSLKTSSCICHSKLFKEGNVIFELSSLTTWAYELTYKVRKYRNKNERLDERVCHKVLSFWRIHGVLKIRLWL